MSNPHHEPTMQHELVPATGERAQTGKVGWALLWLLGIPLPVLIIIYLIRGH